MKHKKLKQSAIVAPVTGVVQGIQVPSVTPVNASGVLQSCQVVPQQRQPKESPVSCKCPKEMVEKLATITSDLQSLTELVKEMQQQQLRLTTQSAESQQHVNTRLDKQGQQLAQQMETIRSQQEQHNRQWLQFQQTQSQQFLAQQQAHNEAQQQAQQAQQARDAQQAAQQQPQTPQQQKPAEQPVQLQQIQLQSYQNQLQQISPSKSGQPQQVTPISLGDGKFFIPSQPSNGQQTPLQMIAIPSNMIQGLGGLQGLQNIQSIQSLQSLQGIQNGAPNFVQFVTQGSPSTVKKCRQTEIRPKQPIAARPEDPLCYNNSSPSVHTTYSTQNTLSSPSVQNTVCKTTNILEEASKVLSSSHTEMDSEQSLELSYNNSMMGDNYQSSPCQEKDVLSAAIMNIPTTYAQCDGIQQSFTESMREVDTSQHNMDNNDHLRNNQDNTILGNVVTSQPNINNGQNSEMQTLNQAINVVLMNPNDLDNSKIQIPSYLSNEVIDCIYRKSKEPSIYALNVCREILSKEEFINNDFKSFVNKNPLKYKFVENLLSTKFCLYSDNLQSILKDVRIKFNNYHRHVKRACRLKEQQKLEHLEQSMKQEP